MTLALALLLIACATPEPVVERVEVPVTQLVDRVVEQTVDAPVTATVAATPPPASTPTPTPASTPVATATPPPAATPTPQPTPVDLESATSADAWIHVRNRMNDWIDVYAKTSDGDWDRSSFQVFVDGQECYNYGELQAGEALQQLDCWAGDAKPHSSVKTVSVRALSGTPASGRTLFGEMRCERNAASTDEVSIFACAWR